MIIVKCGFILGAVKIMVNNNFLKEFSENTEVSRYLRQLYEEIFSNVSENFKNKYAPIIKANMGKKQCFLSVIIRTQGKREDGLREALLCLQAQTFQNFEIILIGHKLDADQADIVERVLEDQSPDFRNKIRYFKLDEGGRTCPINFGFANSLGKYAAVFDDDDILFANWAEDFYTCSKDNDGRILHSYAFAQNWSNVKKLGYRAESAPVPRYCVDFQLIDQLVVNRCPLMTLAFPVNIFQNLGMIFNEELDVMEDWEYFMRTAFLCGVSDTKKATAIYRFWDNLETSATLHEQSTWDSTYQAIQEEYNQESIIIPPGNLQRIINLLNGSHNHPLTMQGNVSLSRLYYSFGDGFNDRECLISVNEKSLPQFDIWFLFEEKRHDIKALRFDLTESGLLLIKDIEITVWLTNGEKEVISRSQCVHNGITIKSGMLFLHVDPEIVWEWNDDRDIDVVHITGIIATELPRKRILDYIESLLMFKDLKRRRQLHQKRLF